MNRFVDESVIDEPEREGSFRKSILERGNNFQCQTKEASLLVVACESKAMVDPASQRLWQSNVVQPRQYERVVPNQLLPFARHRQITLMAERIDAGINRTAIPLSVSIRV